jgi:hypothetical protein
MTQINAGKIFLMVLIDEIKTILYFPIWWYSRGFLEMLKRAKNFIISIEQGLGFWIWVKNLFVPMFGQRDLSGRIISFFLRLFQIFVKGLVLVIVIVIVIVVIIVWLVLPIFVLYQALIHFYG